MASNKITPIVHTRPRNLSVRLSPAERARFDALAAHWAAEWGTQVSLAAVITKCVLERAELEIPKEEKKRSAAR